MEKINHTKKVKATNILEKWKISLIVGDRIIKKIGDKNELKKIKYSKFKPSVLYFFLDFKNK